MAIYWNEAKFEAWPEACFDCAFKRGWKTELRRLPLPFPCVHRETLEGKQLVCAGDKKKLEKFKK